jgi:hypothetical protein
MNRKSLTYFTDDDVLLRFVTQTSAGAPFTVEGGAAEFRISRTRGGAAIIALTDDDGITLTGTVAQVEFNTSDVGAVGRFFGQLRIEVAGRGMIVAEIELDIIQRIMEGA